MNRCAVLSALTISTMPAFGAMLLQSRFSMVYLDTYAGSANPGPPFHGESSTNTLDPWYDYISSTSGAAGHAMQSSSLDTNGIYFFGLTGVGGGFGHGGGTSYSAMSVQFEVTEAHAYQLSASVDASLSGRHYRLTRLGGLDTFNVYAGGTLTLTGYIAAGSYEYQVELQTTDMGYNDNATVSLVVAIPQPAGFLAFAICGASGRRRRVPAQAVA